MRVLIISEEPRLTGLVQNALGSAVSVSAINQWKVAKSALTQVRFDLICLDYQCVRNENLDVVVSLRSLLASVDTTLCLLVRQVDADVQRFQVALPRLDDVIDMSMGKEHFNQRLTKHKRSEEATALLTLESELHASLIDMRRSTKYEVFGISKGCGRQIVHARYRSLVKKHHPDVYGSNVSPRVKELSLEIFLTLKEHYLMLLASEPDLQSAPKPAPKSVVSESADSSSTLSRIESLSGFKSKQALRSRRQEHGLAGESSEANFPHLEMNSESFLSEVSDVEETLSLAETSAAERKQKVEALATRSQEMRRGGIAPARQAFNAGYLLFREKKFPEALALVKRAHELNPDPLNSTYYAHLLFRLDPGEFRRSEKLLQDVIDRGAEPECRQALPDAHLFLGHLFKARNQPEKALAHYESALQLNPGCVEAEREVRRSELRSKRLSTNPGDYLRNVFKNK